MIQYQALLLLYANLLPIPYMSFSSAQYEYADPEDIIARAIQEILANVYSKSQIVDIMQNYVTINEFNDTLQKFTTKLYVDQQIAALEKKLLVYLQGTEEPEDPVTDK